VLDAPEEHYEPPPPPPLPVLAPATLYSLLLIVVGVLLVFRPGTVGLTSDVGLVLGVASVAGAVFVLVSRMRERSVDDGDDGAVV
jgi:drug/metabolite transporter (DMT)-like permease